MSHVSPDRRKGCGNGIPFFGGCSQHHRSSSAAITVWKNITKVQDFMPGSCSNWREPYAAPNINVPNCSPFFDYACGDCINGNLYCGPLSTGSLLTGMNDASHSVIYSGKYWNLYEATTQSVDLSTCAKMGFKNVYARKAWVGIKGYTSREKGNADSYTWCIHCGWHNYDASPDQTKYLAWQGTYNQSYDVTIYNDDITGCTYECPDPVTGDPVTYSGSCHNQTLASSNHYSEWASINGAIDKCGNQLNSSCSSGSSGYADDYSTSTHAADAAQQASQYAGSDVSLMVGAYNTALNMGRPPDLITGGPSAWHVEWYDTYTCYDQCGNPTSTNTYTVVSADIDIPGGTCDVYYYTTKASNNCSCDGTCYSVILSQHQHYVYGDITMAFHQDGNNDPSWSVASNFTADATGELSSPYTAGDAYNDAIGLLNQFPLNDDDVYPWRSDAYQNYGPLLSFDETETGNVTPSFCASEGANVFSGRVKGKPLPKGYEPAWDFERRNVDNCLDPDTGCTNYNYTKTYGDWCKSPDGFPVGTQWTDWGLAAQLPKGAFAAMNFLTIQGSDCNANYGNTLFDDVIWVGKVAYTVVPRPSINFSRPCGQDRFAVIAESASCVSSVSGNTLTLTAPPTFDASVSCSVAGLGALDGIWSITLGPGANDVTLNNLNVSGSQITRNYDPGVGNIAPLRWPNAPAICGRNYLTNVTRTNPITCSLEDTSYLVDGDKVFINEVKGVTAANGYWSVVVIDPKTIVLSGSFGSGSAAYIPSGYAQSPFTPDWRWDDDSPKGQGMIVEWLYDIRSVGEYNRLQAAAAAAPYGIDCNSNPCPVGTTIAEPRPHQSTWGLDQAIYAINTSSYCLPVNPCNPRVVCISPNAGDVFPGGTTSPFCPNFKGDSQYGFMWRKQVIQHINSPFWHEPPCKCISTVDANDNPIVECCGMSEDDGLCNEDVSEDPDLGIPCKTYYAHRPMVEALNVPPTGSPALPYGTYLGCLTQPEIDVASKPAGNVWTPNAWENYLPWVLYLAESGCVCSGGRFAQQYIDDGTACQSSFLPPPF